MNTIEPETRPPCCPSPTGGDLQTEGTIATSVGEVPRVGTTMRFADHVGAWKARWGIGRMGYMVEPGLYAVGDPSSESPVLVSANYKMSFDRLRAQLGGFDAWIMVLDTKGINVWCAAGKGTFGTKEIVHRVKITQLAEVVSHRKLIVPQLGAPGVGAQAVRSQTGFQVVYGPVRAEDLPAYLAAGMEATAEMRRVRFPLGDRLALVPIELLMWIKWALAVAACLFVLAGLGRDGYSVARALSAGGRSAFLFLSAYAASAALTPALLPWLPGRSFSAKGAWAGLLLVLVLGACAWPPNGDTGGWLSGGAWALIIVAAASFVGMNFTGASTYASLSGVQKEMRVAVPTQAASGALGLLLWLVALFF